MRAHILLFGSLLALAGCGSGKSDDQQESVSSESNVDIVDCSGATFEGLSPAEVADLVDAADEGSDISVAEEKPGLDQSAALKTYKLTIIQGCGNGVVNEDNDTVSDDDVTVSGGTAQ